MTYTIEQLDKIIKEQSHARISLLNPRGGKILGWNNSKKSIPDWWMRIRRILTDPNLEKGLYQVIMKRSSSTDAAQEIYEVEAGQRTSSGATLRESAPQPQQQQNQFDIQNPIALQFMSLQADLSELKAENRFLERDNQRLNAEVLGKESEIITLQEQIEAEREEKETLKEMQKPGQIQGTITAAMPLIDKYFELREKEASIQEKKINSEAKQEAEKIAKSIPDYVKRLVTPTTGAYYDVEKCDIEIFMSYFENPDDFNAFLQQLQKENLENAISLSKRVNEYASKQQQTKETANEE